MITIKFFKTKEVPYHYDDRLRRLSLHGGDMKKIYNAIRRGDPRYSDVGIFIAQDQFSVVYGWALAFRETDCSPYINIQIFVDPVHRRKGIGTQLIRAVKRKYRKKLYGNHWSCEASEFFRKNLMGDNPVWV